MNKFSATPGSSMDSEILNEAYDLIHGPDQFPDVEEQIIARENDKRGEQDNILRRGEICYEFVNSQIYSMTKQYLIDIEKRVHREFEDAETDLNGSLRIKWHATRDMVKEIIGNWEIAAANYVENLKQDIPNV